MLRRLLSKQAPNTHQRNKYQTKRVPYVIIILSFLCLMDCSVLYALVVGVAELKNTLPRIAVIAFLREGFFCGVK